MNTDEKGMNTDDGDCFAKHKNHSCSSVDIRVHHLQAARPLGVIAFSGLRYQYRNRTNLISENLHLTIWFLSGFPSKPSEGASAPDQG
jgi:hypothetical protein